MPDYLASLPVRTETNGDVAAKIVDGTTVANAVEVKSTKEMMVALRNPTSTNVVAVNADGSINVNMSQGQVGTEKHLYNTVASGVPNTPSDVIDYTVTALKTFLLKQFQASCAGQCKVQVTEGANTIAVAFITTANGQIDVMFDQPIEIAAGTHIKVTMTNRDKGNTDLYAFINGNEV